MTAPLQERALRHGHCSNGESTPTYYAWAAMIQRCANRRDKAYANYGGRGITVCERWRESFEVFLADVGERPGPGLSLDRIDNDRGYEPGNVRWATRVVQNTNQRRNRNKLSVEVEADIVARIERGEGLHDIARALGLNKNRPEKVWRRMRPGLPNPNRGRAMKDRP